MADLDLCYTPATELARKYRSREVSPLEVIQNSLDRIDEVNPALNCFCFTYPEEALAKARAAEQAFASGSARPLEGIPLAIKDFTPTRGKVTTRGSRLLENWVPDWDPVLVQRLEAAGAIMVGKTTTPEFATSGFTDSPLWGITRNPWNTARTPGGSSGGSGAAVASGCVPIAEGTDMGGSVRIPAALCGIVGLKPSLGRIPMDIIDTAYCNISHFGPLARSVGDATLFLDIVQGEHPADIQSLPRCKLDFPPSGNVEGMKFALDVTLGFCAVDADVEANLRSTANALREAGAIIEEVNLGWDARIIDLWNGSWAIFMAAAYRQLTDVPLDENRERMSEGLVRLIETGLQTDAVSARQWEFERTRYWRKLGAVLEDHHALLCPTMAITAPPVEMRDWDFDQVNEQGLLECMDMTAQFNYTAQCPAISVPSGFANGLPTATQVVARRWDDALALRIAAAIEKSMPWSHLHPDI
ncbi:MAG: amidase [Gammaproteobacteria bacterium]|nr:amidase [Gammaproteobacteria bacterium]MDH3535677.1 amidase [Gammaproteobacteria bacterium]